MKSVIREGFREEVTFETQGSERVAMGGIWGRTFLGRRRAHAKVLGQDRARCVGGTARRPVWLEQSVQGVEDEEEEGSAGRGWASHAGPLGS